MNRLALLVATIALSAIDLNAQPVMLKVRPEDSHVGFSISKWGIIKEEGRFREFSGKIKYDPSHPSGTEVEFTVYTRSVDSRNERRDNALRSHEFFHVSRYPTMTFKSTRTIAQHDGQLLIEGELTIRGITKHVTVPVKVLGLKDTGSELGTLAGFEAMFTVDREEFGIGDGWAIIGREATIQLLIGAGSGHIASR